MRRRATLAILALLLAATAFAASRPAAEQAKIDWLLEQIRTSDAVFIRNGSEYDGVKAASHIKSKLWFAGDRVKTAKDFILGVASKSEASGKPYEIRPKGATATKPLGAWLFERLAERDKAEAEAAKKK